MASTNKTTHYELSQYVSSDKPTYLVDYNGDMAKIDTAINTAKTTADTASTSATNAQTAAEGAQTTANTAVTNAASAQTTADGANTKIGTLANLTTSEKTNLVGAINEVNDKEIVVNSLSGTSTTKAPSVASVKSAINSVETGYTLFSGDTANDVTLNDVITNYDEIEIEFKEDSTSIYSSTRIPVDSTVIVDLHATEYATASGHVYRGKTVTLNGNSITNQAGGGFTISAGGTSYFSGTQYIRIVKVIGYKHIA